MPCKLQPGHRIFVPFLTLSDGKPGAVSLDSARLEIWSGHLAAIAAETQSRAQGCQFGVHAHLSLLLLDLCRPTGSASQAVVQADDPVLESVFAFIERNYKRQITLAHLAQAAGRSAAHLTTMLRRRIGLTGQEWITERRMSEARRPGVY